MKDTKESLEREEKELEERMFGTPPSEATTEDEATKEKTGAEEAHAREAGPVTPKPKPATDEQSSSQTVEDWEKRYKNLRASRDTKLYDVNMQLSTALSRIENLQTELTQLRSSRPTVDPLEGVFTDEDTEALGDATVEAMRRVTKKATDAATAPLRKQLEEERKLREHQSKQSAERTKHETYNLFLSRIANAVPDWEEVNYNPAFIEWCKQPDIDGTPRSVYFSRAEAQGNAALIIRYMLEFKESLPPPKVDKLASKVTPLGEGGGSANVKTEGNQEEIVSYAFIDKFYDDLARGRYKGRATEAKKIEAMIDKATLEGRIG